MKTRPNFTLILLIFLMLVFLPNTFAQDNSLEYIVRVIYFIPNDQEPDPNMDEKLDTLIKNAQKFYADQLEVHGFDRKTFRFEPDENGDVKVHHVNGKFNDAYYQNPFTGSWIVWDEIDKQFDTSKNIYFLALDTTSNTIDGNDNIFGRATFDSRTGKALVPVSKRGAYPGPAFHELGHAFGLEHDYRLDRPHANRIYTSWLRDWMLTSFCAAEWLNANRYFNSNQKEYNENTDVQFHQPNLVEPPSNLRLRFTLTDPDGLHQAQLFFQQLEGEDDSGNLIAYQSLSGKNTSIEFLIEIGELIGVSNIRLKVMDKHGNFIVQFFPIDITNFIPDKDIGISIPDSNLASAVRKVLRVPSSVVITRLDMLKLKVAHFDDGQITDLTGLEHAINLRDLSLFEQQVQDITPLAKLPKLARLNLRGNPINDITPLAGMINLRALHLGETQIIDITPLAGLTNLGDLFMFDNQINDISPLAGLRNLQLLDLSSNQISDITPLERLTNLMYLYLHANSIIDITPLTGLTNLESLILYENKIKDITPLTDLTNLMNLHLGVNEIDNITPLTRLTELTILQLYSNQISDISPLRGLTKLTRLFPSHNKISELSPLEELTKLTSLDLRSNQFRDISPLRGLTKLTRLFLSYNQIRDISPLKGLTKLDFLHLRQIQVSDISPLRGLTELTHLDLYQNQISNVSPLANLVNLKTLDLVDNPIKNIKPLFDLLQKKPDVIIYLKDYKTPLPVTLSHFRAEHTNAGILLKWTTESEVDNAGFYIYRSQTKDGEFKVVNPQLIQGAGTTSKRSNYTWTDTTAKPNTVYYYRIEDVSHAGVRVQLATVRLRGLVSAKGKLTTRWGDLKMSQ